MDPTRGVVSGSGGCAEKQREREVERRFDEEEQEVRDAEQWTQGREASADEWDSV